MEETPASPPSEKSRRGRKRTQNRAQGAGLASDAMSEMSAHASSAPDPARPHHVALARVRDLDLTYVRPTRAGGIPFTRHGGCLRLALGIDSLHKEITDLAGGVGYRRENAIGGAIRELHEESLGVFGTITEADVSSSLAVFDKENLVIFVEVNVCPAATKAEFHRRLAKIADAEVSDLIWLTPEELRIALIRGDVYDKTRTLLLAAGDFASKL